MTIRDGFREGDAYSMASLSFAASAGGRRAPYGSSLNESRGGKPLSLEWET